MTADAHQDLSRTYGPRDELVAPRPAYVEAPAGRAASEGAGAAQQRASSGAAGDFADHGQAGWSPFPVDAIEID